VSPWTLNALASFPPFVITISASAVGVIAAATSARPNVTRPGQDHEQQHPGGDVAGAFDLGQGAEVVSCHTEVERRLAGLQQEANAENDDEPCPQGRHQISICDAIRSPAPPGS
jgi:hypothetical protein